MSVETLEKEFSEFCAQLSERELEQNPGIKKDIGAIRRMIADVRERIRRREDKRAEVLSARQAWIVYR